jgi:hypothetical protein
MGTIFSWKKFSYSIGVLLFMTLALPAMLFSEVFEVTVVGFDDGVKSSRQKDYEEAVLSAKAKAIESKPGAVLLPGYQIVDIGYLESGKYSVMLIGKIETQDTKTH